MRAWEDGFEGGGRSFREERGARGCMLYGIRFRGNFLFESDVEIYKRTIGSGL